MSIDALSWAFNLDLPNSGIKLTLLALANYANEENCTAYPSQKTIAKKTCLSDRAIRGHLVVLEQLGVISRVSRKREDGTFTTDMFTLNVGFSPPKSIGRNYRRQNLPSAKNSKIQRKNLPNPAEKSAYQEPSLTTTKAKNQPSLVAGEEEETFALEESSAPEKHPAPTDEVWHAFNNAYFNRYGAEYKRTGKANGQLMNFLKIVGKEEAPYIATFYVSHNNRYYVQKSHTIGPMLADAESLRTQWITGRAVTSGKAADLESTSNNADAVKEAMEIWRRRNGHANV